MFFEPFVPMDTKLEREYSTYDVRESLKKYNKQLIVDARVKKIRKILDICKNNM